MIACNKKKKTLVSWRELKVEYEHKTAPHSRCSLEPISGSILSPSNESTSRCYPSEIEYSSRVESSLPNSDLIAQFQYVVRERT